MLGRVFYNLVILGFGVFMLLLAVSGQLTYFVHPRYINFSIVMTFVALVFAVLALGREVWSGRGQLAAELIKLFKAMTADRKLVLLVVCLGASVFISLLFVIAALVVLLPFPGSKLDRLLRQNVWGEALLLLVLFVGFVLPARPLSSATAAQRELDFNSLNVTEQLNLARPFSFGSEKYTIGDWVTSLRVNPDVGFYIGKQVEVVGFVYLPAGIEPGSFLVSRFIITCCAVDARPIGITVYADTAALQQDMWVKVKGKFGAKKINGVTQVVIIPETVEQVSIPSDPYLF